MKRWIKDAGPEGLGDYGEDPQVDACLDELVAVLNKYGFVLGHEDEHGGFILHPVSEETKAKSQFYGENLHAWLMAACKGRAE